MNLSKTINLNWHFILQSGFTILISTYLLIIAGTTQGMMNLNILVIDLIILAVLAATWILRPIPFDFPLKKAILAWIFVFVLSAVFSIDPRRSLDQFIVCAAGIFIFYFTGYLLQKRWRIETIIQGLLVSGAILMLFAWLELGFWYFHWISVNPSIIIPTIQYRPASANIIAMSLNLFLILAISRIFQPEIKKSTRLLLLLYILSDLFILYITSSRGGWIGTAAGIATFVLLFPLVFKETSRKILVFFKSHRYFRVLLFASLAPIAAGFIYILLLQSRHPTHGDIFTSRAPFWEPAWQEFLKDPLTGTGPFTFGSTFMRYNSIPNDVIYAHSHGTPVNTLSEMGIPGLAAGLFLAVSAILALWKRIRSADREVQSASHLALSSLTAVMVHSVFDCFHLEPGGLWILFVLVAIPLSQGVPRAAGARRPWFFILPVVMLGITIWMRAPYMQGVQAANQNQWQSAAQSFQEAIARDPWSAINHQQAGITYAVLAEEEPGKYLMPAIQALEKTVQIDPDWALNYANLGKLYARAGDYEKAVQNLRQAIELAPNAAIYNKELGQTCEAGADFLCANSAYQGYLDRQPPQYDGDFWEQTEIRGMVLSTWQALHPVKDLSVEELLRQLAENNQSMWAYNQLAKKYVSLGYWGEAESVLKIGQFAFAGWQTEVIDNLMLKAEVNAAYRRDEITAVYRQEAEEMIGRVGLFGPGTFGVLYYAPRMYRVPAVAVEIVPEIIHGVELDFWAERERTLINWQDQSN